MKPQFRVLSDKLIDQIVDEGLQLLMDPGIRVRNQEALTLLAEAGARVDFDNRVVSIPEGLVRKSLETAPSEFSLYTMDGIPVVHYDGDTVQFNPCSTALHILDSKTQKQRQPITTDMVKFVKLVETIPQLDAQSTALVCADVPKEIADLYRLYVALHYMRKPIVTGAFSKETLHIMKDLLVAVVGDEAELAARPRAVFDVCPSPPLLWSDFTCQNLIDCARSKIPTQLISMPLTGATAPVTLAGAVVQHAAETMSGITISQLANPGAPVVWGGSPSAFDMRHGTTPMGAVETWMVDAAFVEVGKALHMPTNAYLGLSDAKVVDAQCGLEACGGIFIAVLVGVNMVSSPGMLDFESCQSFEKLVVDAEIINMARRLTAGIEARETPIALELMREMGHRSDYLAQPHTQRWFREELYAPSEVIDRSPVEEWERNGAKRAFERASERVEALVGSYEPLSLPEEVHAELLNITLHAARKFGMHQLPDMSCE